jgi:hypothetical protein
VASLVGFTSGSASASVTVSTSIPPMTSGVRAALTRAGFIYVPKLAYANRYYRSYMSIDSRGWVSHGPRESLSMRIATRSLSNVTPQQIRKSRRLYGPVLDMIAGRFQRHRGDTPKGQWMKSWIVDGWGLIQFRVIRASR